MKYQWLKFSGQSMRIILYIGFLACFLLFQEDIYMLSPNIAMKTYNHCCFEVCNRVHFCPLKAQTVSHDTLTWVKLQFLICTVSSWIYHTAKDEKWSSRHNVFLLFRGKKKKRHKKGKITSAFSPTEQSKKDAINCRKTWKSVFSHASSPKGTVPSVNSQGRSSPHAVRCRVWPVMLIKLCLSISVRVWVLFLEGFQVHGSISFSFYSWNSLTPGKSFIAFNCIRCTVRHMLS